MLPSTALMGPKLAARLPAGVCRAAAFIVSLTIVWTTTFGVIAGRDVGKAGRPTCLIRANMRTANTTSQHTGPSFSA
jgi:hypothetical protein